MKCPKCGSRDIDFQESGGQSICVSCGTVLEENTIVSSIEFQVCNYLQIDILIIVLGIWRSLTCRRPICICFM